MSNEAREYCFDWMVYPVPVICQLTVTQTENENSHFFIFNEPFPKTSSDAHAQMDRWTLWLTWDPDGFVHLFESPELKLRSQQNTTHVDYMNIWYTLHTYVYIHYTLQYRLLSEALVLTGADICSAVKPWDVQYPTAMDVFSEYHDQVIPLISHLVSQKKLPFFGSTNFYVSFPKNLSLLVFFGSDRSPRQTQPNGVMWVWERSKEDERAWYKARRGLKRELKRQIQEGLGGAMPCRGLFLEHLLID